MRERSVTCGQMPKDSVPPPVPPGPPFFFSMSWPWLGFGACHNPDVSKMHLTASIKTFVFEDFEASIKLGMLKWVSPVSWSQEGHGSVRSGFFEPNLDQCTVRFYFGSFSWFQFLSSRGSCFARVAAQAHRHTHIYTHEGVLRFQGPKGSSSHQWRIK